MVVWQYMSGTVPFDGFDSPDILRKWKECRGRCEEVFPLRGPAEGSGLITLMYSALSEVPRDRPRSFSRFQEEIKKMMSKV